VLPETSTAILGPTLENWKVHTKAITSVVSEQDSVSGCLLPGKHNAINAAMALRCAAAITRSAVSDRMIHSVRSFHGLPHRLNRKVLGNGLVIVNDSKSTVPEATLLAVDAVAEQTPRSRIHLICGGSDKGSDLSLIAALHDQLAGIYTIGTTGKSLANGSNAHYCETLERAVEMAIKAVAPGDTILLSPGCASWDQFTNYEQRGERFVVLATQLANERFKNTSCSHNS
ncbi:MAG: hypothetical protein JKX70_10915, partial [Phycisphaerales bacterium]|nr:hypothetical protein [Phycisphaerales bacterium]